MRRLYLMRHGETLYLGRGSPDGTDLTPEGRRQAGAAAELLRSVRLDLVVSSPLARAMDTAAIVAAPQGLRVEPLDDLREITPGDMTGMGVAEVLAGILRFFSSPEVTWDTPYLRGETFRQLRARVGRVLDGLLARPGWVNTLAVAHGGTNVALLSCVLGLADGEMPRLEQDLGCIDAIDFDAEGRPLVRLVNLSAHDLVKAALREPSVARLRRLLEDRGREVQGARLGPDGSVVS